MIYTSITAWKRILRVHWYISVLGEWMNAVYKTHTIQKLFLEIDCRIPASGFNSDDIVVSIVVRSVLPRELSVLPFSQCPLECHAWRGITQGSTWRAAAIRQHTCRQARLLTSMRPDLYTSKHLKKKVVQIHEIMKLRRDFTECVYTQNSKTLAPFDEVFILVLQHTRSSQRISWNNLLITLSVEVSFAAGQGCVVGEWRESKGLGLQHTSQNVMHNIHVVGE